MSYLGKYKAGSTAHAVAIGRAYFTNLYQNGLTVNATNGPTIGAMQAQQIKMAIIQSSACYAHELTDFPTMRVKYLDSSVELPGVFGIDAKMPAIVRADAQKFLDWLMTKPGQHAMQTGDPTGDSLYWPTLQGIAPANAIIPSLTSTRAISINPYVWGPLETSINTWFDAAFVNG
jgi:iron(III) transport system substrate-binding protein